MDQNERILNKLDKMEDQLAKMNATLKVQAQQLREHMRRSETLEMLAQDYRVEADAWRVAMLDKIKPVEDHVTMMRGASKVFAVLGAIAALILGVLKLFFGN